MDSQGLADAGSIPASDYVKEKNRLYFFFGDAIYERALPMLATQQKKQWNPYAT